MKKLLLVAVLLICITAVPARAHSGRTDSNGGHYNRSTGEYHYHHGYPAHQHEGGVCPYDFDDKTQKGQANNKMSSTGKTDAVNSAAASEYTIIIPPSEKTEPIYKSWWFWGIIAFATYKILKRSLTYIKKKNEYSVLYGGRSAESIANMPEDTEIGKDGLPREKGADGWGKLYTVYRSRTGKVVHRKGCHKSATHPVHVWSNYFITPCQRCRPTIPDRGWYKKYQEIAQIKKKYRIK